MPQVWRTPLTCGQVPRLLTYDQMGLESQPWELRPLKSLVTNQTEISGHKTNSLEYGAVGKLRLQFAEAPLGVIKAGQEGGGRGECHQSTGPESPVERAIHPVSVCCPRPVLWPGEAQQLPRGLRPRPCSPGLRAARASLSRGKPDPAAPLLNAPHPLIE